jgi:carbon storage regulator
MLVLSRRESESIVVTLPDQRRIRITLVEMQRDRARIGFDAPKDVVIHRDEVQASIDRENSAGGAA